MTEQPTTAVRRDRPMAFLIYCSGFVAIIVAATVAFLLGQPTVAWIIGNLGTFGYMMAVLAWAAIFDSRKKWPRAGAWTRLGNVLTFQRGDV